MTISATVIADSISEEGIRLTTFQLRYPRFIHAELMTHRVFSRNASSSRAIPVKKMIEDLRRDPAMPVYWGSNKPGMQAGDELGYREKTICEERWLMGMNEAIATAERLMQFGLHKQIANRILEPWAHINVVVTATDWNNFYALRRHPDAQPEIKVLADAMWDAHETGPMPKSLKLGEWHLPYCTQKDQEAIQRHLIEYDMLDNPMVANHLDILKKISVARCARVSYLTHEGKQTTVEEDLTLFDRLLGSVPLHASPAEHQATPDFRTICPMTNEPEHFHNPELHGNFTGWIQYRKTLDGEFTPG